MLFNSLEFAIFFPIVFIIYWIVSSDKRLRNLLLLAASYFFYGWWDWRFLFLIILSSAVDFIIGQRIFRSENKKSRKAYLLLSLLVNLGLLAYFKYADFFIETFVDSFRLFGKELQIKPLQIILPVGISFYTFQTLSYTIDIYRQKIKPTRNILQFFTFVSFFPQLVAGPIERASHLLPQFDKTYKFSYQMVKGGFLLIAFGLFKKMVIADRVSILVNEVYNNPTGYFGYELVIATIFFAFQIYCDFSGYSDIAIGVARTMGFDLMKNFDSPYFSKSLTEFWRRWHISLSTWFRDYLYIPLGGSRKGKYRTYSNLFIVFVVSGLWHGAALTFIIWGAIHGVILIVEKATQSERKKVFGRLGLERNNFSNKLFFGLVTFSIVCFSWIFFRANSMLDALTIVKNLFASNYYQIFNGGLYSMGLSKMEFIFSILMIITLVAMESLNGSKKLFGALSRQSTVLRWSFYVGIIVFIAIFGVYGDASNKEFIYFQF